MKRVAFFVLTISAFLVGCTSNRAIDAVVPEIELDTKEYQIGVGDTLQINVWKSPELSSVVPVRPDGRISLPLLGDVMAAGQTTNLLSATLHSGLNKFVRNPQVTVVVTAPSSGEYLRRVRATGAFVRQVSIPHQQGITILDLVLEAGGLTPFANGNKARLFRKISGQVKVYPVYLEDILFDGKVETNYTLSPSDILTVPERMF